ncbi:MAG: hypothetical protein AB7W28_06755 [Armatimonadota bacterium]
MTLAGQASVGLGCILFLLRYNDVQSLRAVAIAMGDWRAFEHLPDGRRSTREGVLWELYLY